MATRTVEAELLLTAKDKTKAAFRSVSKQLAQVDKQAKSYNKRNSSMARNAAAVARGVGLVATAAATATAASYKKFAGDERTLTRIGITADATREQMALVRDSLFEIADATGQQFEDSVRGLDALTASGKSLQESMAFLPSIMATAQAAGADVADIATSADALSGSFGITADKMQGAFDILVAGGKAGKFELKDMAQFIPSIAPAFKALGYEGEAGLKKLVAALQTVRKQTGTSGEAATAFMDILTKMESTAITSNFKKFGINIRKEMETARKAGKDVLQTFIDLSHKAVNGDMAKLPRLFTDKQMLIGMRALMTGGKDMAKFQAALAKVDGATMKDLNIVLADQETKLNRLSLSWSKMMSTLGAAVAPGVGKGFDKVTSVISEQRLRKAADAEIKKRTGESMFDSNARFEKDWSRRTGKPTANFWNASNRVESAYEWDRIKIKWAKGGFKGDPMDIVQQEADALAAALRAKREMLQSGRRGRGPVPSIAGVQGPGSGNRLPKYRSRTDERRAADMADQYGQYRPGKGPSRDQQSVNDIRRGVRAGDDYLTKLYGGNANALDIGVDMDTAPAEKSIADLKAKAEMKMVGSMDIDTAPIMGKLNAVEKKATGIMSLINKMTGWGGKLGGGRGTGRATGNRRTTMPDAGVAKP